MRLGKSVKSGDTKPISRRCSSFDRASADELRGRGAFPFQEPLAARGTPGGFVPPQLPHRFRVRGAVAPTASGLGSDRVSLLPIIKTRLFP
jgi:hypothetical protein